jgi:hypothetical protein
MKLDTNICIVDPQGCELTDDEMDLVAGGMREAAELRAEAAAKAKDAGNAGKFAGAATGLSAPAGQA